MEIVEREIDKLGRIVIPKAWRASLGKNVMLYHIDGEVRVKPRQTKKFSTLKLKIDITSNLSDWHAVKKELME